MKYIGKIMNTDNFFMNKMYMSKLTAPLSANQSAVVILLM